jgi:hypothetical protein
LLLVTAQVMAHGEDKPGPNGGKITMPGAFHVEVVPVDERQLKVYLLDLDFKNPVVKGSSLKVTHGSVVAKCKEKSDHFVCDFPAQINLNQPGEIKVTATRDKQKGNRVEYALPIKFDQGH